MHTWSLVQTLVMSEQLPRRIRTESDIMDDTFHQFHQAVMDASMRLGVLAGELQRVEESVALGDAQLLAIDENGLHGRNPMYPIPQLAATGYPANAALGPTRGNPAYRLTRSMMEEEMRRWRRASNLMIEPEEELNMLQEYRHTLRTMQQQIEEVERRLAEERIYHGAVGRMITTDIAEMNQAYWNEDRPVAGLVLRRPAIPRDRDLK